MKNTLKVVWICHFTNEEVQDYLPLWKRSCEFGQWIPNTIAGFKERDDVELHVVVPHIYLKRSIDLNIDGIYYHFIAFGFPLINRPWPSFFALDAVLGYPGVEHKIVRKVTQINPDIINLQGAENAYYSSSILKLKDKYPIVISIQGFAMHMSPEIKSTVINKRRIKVEKQILQKFNYYYLDPDAINVIKTYNKYSIGYTFFWPANEQLIDSIQDTKQKKYDLLFCARIEQSKGIEDFIRIVSILKGKNKNIKACVIGPGLSSYYTYLKSLANDLSCAENIDFKGFIGTQGEMFSYFKMSVVFLVPTLIDRLPSTIREAMRLKIPVVAYRTGNIPWINYKSENIVLVDHGDFRQMAKEVEELLEDVERQKKLVSAACDFYKKEFSCKINVDRFIDGYKEVIKVFRD